MKSQTLQMAMCNLEMGLHVVKMHLIKLCFMMSNN